MYVAETHGIPTKCEQYTQHSRTTHAYVLARTLGQGAAVMLSTFASFKNNFITMRAMFPSVASQSHPSDTAHFPLHPAPPHLLRGPQGETQQASPLHSGPFGRLAIQSPVTSYKPNPTLEVTSTEDTPANPTSRRTSFCSTYNSVEEVPTTLSSGEVDESRIVRLASLLLEQKRGTCRPSRSLSFSRKTPRHTPHNAQGNLSQDIHTWGNRAGTERVHRRDSSPTEEFELKERK